MNIALLVENKINVYPAVTAANGLGHMFDITESEYNAIFNAATISDQGSRFIPAIPNTRYPYENILIHAPHLTYKYDKESNKLEPFVLMNNTDMITLGFAFLEYKNFHLFLNQNIRLVVDICPISGSDLEEFQFLHESNMKNKAEFIEQVTLAKSACQSVMSMSMSGSGKFYLVMVDLTIVVTEQYIFFKDKAGLTPEPVAISYSFENLTHVLKYIDSQRTFQLRKGSSEPWAAIEYNKIANKMSKIKQQYAYTQEVVEALDGKSD